MEFPRRIALSEVKELMQRGLPLQFIDARTDQDWRSSDLQLPGALRVPAGGEESHLGEIARDGTIVVYCACSNEATSAQVAQKLIDHGLARVYALSGGFNRWLEADSPMERKDEKRAKRVFSQPNLVTVKNVATESSAGKGPRGNPRTAGFD